MEEPSEELEEVEAQPEEEVVVVEDVISAEGETNGVLSLIRKRSKEIMASFSACCGAFAVGTIIGWTSPVLPKLNFSEEEQSWIGSCLTIGGALTTFHTAYFLDNLGRRATILVQIFPFTIGWLILAFGESEVYMMYVGRVLLGFACGASSMAAPVYIAEISSPDVRGSLGTGFQLMLTLGILYVYLLGKFVSVTLLCFACLLWAVINFCTMICLPESPFFLAKFHKMEAATKAALWLRPHDDPEKEFQEMQEALHVKVEPFIRVMQWKPARKAAIVVLTLMFFQQVSGINTVMFYSEILFKMSKTSLSGDDATILLGVLQCLVTGVTAAVVDKTGRRILLLGSFAGMAFCQFLLAIYFHAFYSEEKANWLPLFCVYLYIVCFSFGAGPIPWTMLGELLPTAAKGSVSSAAVFTNWTMAFVVTKSFHATKNSLHIAAPFWMYGAFCSLGVFLIFVWVPETKGKTLKQIQKEFEG